MFNAILVHYQELALKGRNRPWFVDRLLRNLREATRGLGVAEVRALMGRIEIVLADGADLETIRRRASRLFGIANFALAERVPADVAAIEEAAIRHTEGLAPTTFRVAAARADKQFPIPSPELERLGGSRIQEVRGWPVDLDAPATVVHVEVVPGAAFCYVVRDRGPGGLPTGVSGRVVSLLSGGIDSPVAAWRMMRRGCRALFVHYHSHPLASRASQDKVRAIVRLLTVSQLHSALVLVPFADIQRRVVVDVPPELRVVIYRRFMLRIADRLARRAGARALVTGEVVGQVASQTLDNLATIDNASTLPVLRPLVGMDKEEITAEARRIGTYEISILPEEDCCQVFAPRHPATRSHHEPLAQIEGALDAEALVEAAVMAAEREEYRGV
jgi:thiamine biosynthesis protein ThiI